MSDEKVLYEVKDKIRMLGQAVCRSAEVTDIQVAIWSQPAIQRDFVLAGALTKLRSGEVRKSVASGFLAL